MKKFSMLAIYGIFLVALSSCMQPIAKPSFIATQSPSPMLIFTLRSYPTPMTVFEYPDQVTDGRLLFSVEEVEKVCHNIGDSIKMKLVFRNITSETINIPKEISFAVNRNGEGGNTIPLITSSDGMDIYTRTDFEIVDLFTKPSDKTYALSANQTTEFIVDYKFPGLILQSPLTNLDEPITPNPGQYNVRFVYVGYPRSSDVWQGVIGSNRVEICLVN